MKALAGGAVGKHPEGGVQREYDFRPDHFERIREVVADLTGITLSDLKQDLVYSRLIRRLRKLRLKSFDEYMLQLEKHPESELGELINAITTNLTAFFREVHHFDYLRDELLPMIESEKRLERRLRIWSAGCSTGEEPYSLAMTLVEAFGDRLAAWDARILATDIDTGVLATAERGVYAEERVRGIPKDLLQTHFRRGTGDQAGQYRVADHLKRLIAFKQLNLNGPWPMRGPFDIIFCRNVVIYFDKPTQRVLFDRMANLMSDDGHLFIGHSENLFRVSERFELIGKTIHRVRSGEA
jgi:chemotaxis protein methyltransferase CheR